MIKLAPQQAAAIQEAAEFYLDNHPNPLAAPELQSLLIDPTFKVLVKAAHQGQPPTRSVRCVKCGHLCLSDQYACVNCGSKDYEG